MAYYYPPQSTHGTRQRSYSHSYGHPTAGYSTSAPVAYPASYSSHHSSPGHHSAPYVQQPAYHAAPQYLAPTYQYGDSGRHRSHHGHARSGSGGPVYTSSAPSHRHSSLRSSPARSAGTVHYPTSRRSSSSHHHSRPTRSQSVPRHTVLIAADSGHRLRRSESRPREPVTHNTSHSRSHHRRGSSSSDLPLGERIRRMFGFGSSSHNYRYGDPHRSPTYKDARTGHPVDWRGRPVYRV